VPTVTTPRFVNDAVKARPRGKAKRRRLVLLIALLGAVVVWPMLAWAGANLLTVKSELASADAIVVMSGSSTYLERADWAARLYREGRAPLIVLTDDKLMSGWDAKEQRNPYYYELTIRELQKRGVPTGRIEVVPDPALGTYYESLNVCEYATTHKFKKLLIVTSAYHSRRVLWSMSRACERSRIETAVSAPAPGWQTPSPWTWWMRRWGWKVVASEYAKMVYYWWRF